jgi:hypothetical protein
MYVINKTKIAVQKKRFIRSDINLMCSMSVHYIIQKTLITKKCTKSFFIYCNTLLHVLTLLGHLQGELSVVVTLRLHYTVERECAVHCALRAGVNSLWSRLVQAQAGTAENSRLQKQLSAQSTAHSRSTV